MHRLSPIQRGRTPAAALIPRWKVTRKFRFRKFIYQNGDIGFPDIERGTNVLRHVFQFSVVNINKYAILDCISWEEQMMEMRNARFEGQSKEIIDTSGKATLPEVVIFEHRHWQGASFRTNLNVSWVGDWWNDRISGIIVASGTWRFYEHINYGGSYWELKQGYYEYISDFGVPNDVISSFQCISW